MPAWIEAGCAEYARRMPRDARIEFMAIKPEAQSGGVTRALDIEAKRILATVPRDCVKVALDERGALLSTRELAGRIDRWRASGRDVAFIIGGAEGLAPGLKRAADFSWSLTPLTLPHALARVVLAEQLYRAISILHNHPYHRD